MTINRMIELLEIEHECMLRKSHDICDGNCCVCELVQDDYELHEMYINVISTLKAQEPMSPITSEVQYGDHLRHCPTCGKSLPNSGEYGKSYYCYKCGQAVKWE